MIFKILETQNSTFSFRQNNNTNALFLMYNLFLLQCRMLSISKVFLVRRDLKADAVNIVPEKLRSDNANAKFS